MQVFLKYWEEKFNRNLLADYHASNFQDNSKCIQIHGLNEFHRKINGVLKSYDLWVGDFSISIFREKIHIS